MAEYPNMTEANGFTTSSKYLESNSIHSSFHQFIVTLIVTFIVTLLSIEISTDDHQNILISIMIIPKVTLRNILILPLPGAVEGIV